MKAALSLTLILAVMTSALPVTAAQERIDRTAGPISRAMTLEAVRLAAERPGWNVTRSTKPASTSRGDDEADSFIAGYRWLASTQCWMRMGSE
jgi:hypothetical protein